ncbi:MAG: DUF3008 family protein [Candidatus Desulfaltia sp.]|nr:DUF3008 family protein [Candidatus Desulfaltia sp.]
MPAKSVKQKRFLSIALAIKKGKLSKKYSPEAAKAARSMSEKALLHYNKTKEKGLPLRKKRKK